MSVMDMIKSLSNKPEKFTGENFQLATTNEILAY